MLFKLFVRNVIEAVFRDLKGLLKLGIKGLLVYLYLYTLYALYIIMLGEGWVKFSTPMSSVGELMLGGTLFGAIITAFVWIIWLICGESIMDGLHYIYTKYVREPYWQAKRTATLLESEKAKNKLTLNGNVFEVIEEEHQTHLYR